MSQHFLIVYAGTDGLPMLRMLSDVWLSEEVSLTDVEFFYKQPDAKVKCKKLEFYAFIPYGGTPGKLDFKNVEGLYAATVADRDSASDYFKRVASTDHLYELMVEMTVDSAMKDKDDCEYLH